MDTHHGHKTACSYPWTPGPGDCKLTLKQYSKLTASYWAPVTHPCKFLCCGREKLRKETSVLWSEHWNYCQGLMAKDRGKRLSIDSSFFFFLASYLQLPHLGQGNVTIHCCPLFRIAPVSISHVLADASYLFWDSNSTGEVFCGGSSTVQIRLYIFLKPSKVSTLWISISHE